MGTTQILFINTESIVLNVYESTNTTIAMNCCSDGKCMCHYMQHDCDGLTGNGTAIALFFLVASSSEKVELRGNGSCMMLARFSSSRHTH